MRPRDTGARRVVLVAAAVLLAALLLVVDLARPALTAPLRDGAATVFGPVRAALSTLGEDETDRLRAENAELAARVAELEEQVDRHAELEGLVASAGDDRELVPARVIGFSPATSPVGGRLVTIDAGTRDGIAEDLTVISADGLVGRVLRVADRTADVLVLGDADVVVGVRVGEDGTLGSVTASPSPGLPPRAYGELTLTALGEGEIATGDEVTTLGSPDGVPYAGRVPLGVVTSVDPDRGQLGRTAVVRPYVDVDTLDVVGVVLSEHDGDER